MHGLSQDLLHALRQVRRSPLFAGAVVLILAFGIGASTAVFSFVDALLFRPFPSVRAPERLVAVHTVYDFGPTVSSYMDFLDLERESRTLATATAFKPVGVDLGTAGETARVRGMLVSATYFEVLGVEPAHGRFFREDEDDTPGGDPWVVLGHGLWSRRFGEDPETVGRTVRLNGRPFTVLGVAGRGFRGTTLMEAPDVFAPMSMQPVFMPASGNLLENRGWGGIHILGRLAEGTSPTQADSEIRRIGARLAEAYPRTNTGRDFAVESFQQARLPADLRGTLFGASGVLAAAVLLVLLVACANVSNLMLARAVRRRRDAALRRALGAGGGRLVRQHLVESGVLGLAGGAAGLLVSRWILDLLGTAPLPFELALTVDGRALAFTACVSLLAAIGVGLLPAVIARRSDLAVVLREERGTSNGGRRRRLTEGLVVTQLALSLPLLAGAGLFLRTLVNLDASELGFRPEGVVVATVDPTLQGYDGDATKAYYGRVLERVRSLPGVEAATIASELPGLGGNAVTVDFERQPEGTSDRTTGIVLVGRDYFRVMGIPLLDGRTFGARDRPGATPVFVMNESGARRYRRLTGLDPLGARVGLEGPDGEFFDVIGVVADSRTESLREEPGPYLYMLHDQAPAGDMGARMSVLARTAPPVSGAMAPVKEAVRSVDPDVPVIQATTLGAAVAEGLAPERLLARVVAGTGLLAVLLAAVGLYGLLAYTVSRRTSEFGIRMALGARGSDILRDVVTRGMLLVGAGLALGLAGAMAATRWLSGLLYGVSPHDPLTLTAAATLLAAVGLVASWLPARRAAAVDPMTALRYE